MKIETKYNIGDEVIFDENRIGKIVGFEICNTLDWKNYRKRSYPQFANNTSIRYQIKPIDNGGELFGSLREESTLVLVVDQNIGTA